MCEQLNDVTNFQMRRTLFGKRALASSYKNKRFYTSHVSTLHTCILFYEIGWCVCFEFIGLF